MERIEKYRNYLMAAGLLLLGIFLGSIIFGGDESPADQVEVKQGQAEETWTCSMHPQIRSDRPGSCPICGMDLITVDEIPASTLSSEAIVLSEEAGKLANIQTSIVSSSDAQREIRLLGTVKPDEGRLYSQVSHLPGRIERLYVSFTGEYIRKGQRMVRLYSPELISAQKELLEAIKSRDVYPQLYKASRSKLKLWKLTDGQIDNIIASGEVQEQIDILADHSGYVMKRNVEVGDHVTPGMNLYEIANLSRVWIMFEAYESDIPWIRPGDEVEFTVKANPGKTYRGKVTYIDPFIDPSARVARVRVEVGNEDGKLLPEMFANGLIRSELNQDSDRLVIPKSAVLWTGKRSIVYVRVPGSQSNAFVYREIQLGPDLGELYIVDSGLEEGEEIATNGVFRIDASAQLSGKKSMMNPEGTGSGQPHDHGGLRNAPDGSHKGDDEATSEPTEDFKDEVEPEFKVQFGKVLQDYMEMKNSLVNDDSAQTRIAVKRMAADLDQVDVKLIGERARASWKGDLEKLTAALQRMESKEDIEELRTDFSNLSDVLSKAVEKYGWNTANENTIYLEFCPMANQDKGGYWLSFDDQIRNPYFGEQMLMCGEVVRSFPK